MLRLRAVVLVVAAGVFVTIPVMFLGTPSELAPTEDQGLILVAVTGPATATLHYLDGYSTQIRRIMDSFPESKQVFEINGLSLGNSGGYNGMIAGTKLVDWSKRSRTQMQLVAPLQAKLAGLAGVQAAAFQKPSLPGSPTGFPVQFVLTSSSGYGSIEQMADAFIAKAMQSGDFAFLTKDLQYDNPEVLVKINRSLAGDLGITMADLGGDLAPLLSGNYVNRFNLSGRSYEVIPQVPDRFRADPSRLREYYVRDAAGGLIPLSTLTSVETHVTPEFLPQMQQLNSATIEGVTGPGVTLGRALDDLEAQARKDLPANFGTDYASQSRQYVQQGNTFL